MMSYRLVCQAGDIFRGGGSAAGSYNPGGQYTCSPSQARSIVGMHGTMDFTVPYETSRQSYISYITRVQSCPSTTRLVFSLPMYYNMQCYERSPCSGGTASVWCIYTGLGHVVPANALLRSWNFWTTGKLGMSVSNTAVPMEPVVNATHA
jgi:poly(3-hydroxybutyrate) depolymerase